MNQIKFSYDYAKLHGQTTAMLLYVDTIMYDGEDTPLVSYDTLRMDGGHYHLKPGQYLVLYFKGNDGIPFTTIRPFDVYKHQYYREHKYEEFEIVIQEQ